MKSLTPLLIALFIFGCGSKGKKQEVYKFDLKPDCNYAIPYSYFLGKNSNGEYGVMWRADSSEITFFLDNGDASMWRSNYPSSYAFQWHHPKYTFHLYSDSCLAKAAIKYYEIISDSLSQVYTKIRIEDSIKSAKSKLKPL